MRPHVLDLFRRFKDAGLTISLHTNDDPDDRWQDGLQEVLRYVDVFLPNAREARRIAGTDDLKDAAKRLSELVPLGRSEAWP